MHDEEAKLEVKKEEKAEGEETKVEPVKPRFSQLDIETPMNIMVEEKFFDKFKIHQLPYDQLLNAIKLSEEEMKVASQY